MTGGPFKKYLESAYTTCCNISNLPVSSISSNFSKKQANTELKKQQKQLKNDRKAQMAVQQALEQDDEIFEYDSIHDKISSTKLREQIEEERKKQNLNNKAPKYIKGLMKTAAKRNLESERRYERRAVRERKDEDHLFADKEKFVTPAFKEKMAKLEKAEQEELRLDAIDEMQDVTKHKDINAFHRHFLNDNYQDPSLTLRKLTGQRKVKGEQIEKKDQEEAIDDAKQQKETIKAASDDEPESPKRRRHDSSSEDEESENDQDEIGSNISGGSNEPNLDENDLEDAPKPTDPELEKLKSRFAIPKNVPDLTSQNSSGGNSSTTGAMKGFAPASTSYSKISTRSKVTAGGAGIETEIDYDWQLFKLNHIFRKKLSDEDIEAAKRKFHQRDAMRDVKGGWVKILSS